MERYSEYKPTSMQWLKEIPSHWEVCLLGCLAKLKTGGTPSFYLKETEKDCVMWYTPSDFTDSYELKEASRKLNKREFDDARITYFPPYSVLIIGIGGTAGKVSYNTIPCYSNQQITAIIPYGDVNCVFCTMYIGSLRDYLIKTAPYTTLPILNNAFLSRIKVPLPPLAEQERIVSYLEDKTSKIYAYVAEKEKEIQLLQELKQKTIADAVTKGLNPNVKMKDSGISWIGMIPEHWELRKLSQVSYEHYISNKDVHHQNLLSLSYGRIIRKDINTTEGLLPASFDTYQIVKEGNIVLRLTDLQNDHKSLRVGLVKEEGIVTSAYVCLGVYNSMIPSYLYNVLHSYDIKKLFYSMGGGLRQNLNWQGMKKIDIPLPPLSEQRAIVAYINEKCQKIDTLVTELQAEIDYMKEYKQRLIADCVTGQVNVQNETI